MLILRDGDIWQSGCNAIVIPVNCVGVAGKGLAKQFSDRYPFARHLYQEACADGYLRPGWVHEITGLGDNPTFFCAATKGHWRTPSQLSWIDSCLCNLYSMVRNSHLERGRAITCLALPALGAGLGGLTPDAVFARVLHYFDNSELPFDIHYYGAPSSAIAAQGHTGECYA